jgi:hypothetical protein
MRLNLIERDNNLRVTPLEYKGDPNDGFSIWLAVYNIYTPSVAFTVEVPNRGKLSVDDAGYTWL